MYGVTMQQTGVSRVVSVKLSELGFDVACRICDLWQPKDLGEFTGEFAPEIPWHGAGLYRVSPTRK